MCVPVTELDPASPDEFILVSDFEPEVEASCAPKESVLEKSLTTTAMYNSDPVWEVVDCTSPSEDGKAGPDGLIKDPPVSIIDLRTVCPTNSTMTQKDR